MSRKLLLLNLLEQAGEHGITTAEIIQSGVGSRYGARLLELREDGYIIESQRVRQGSFRYILQGTIPRTPPLLARLNEEPADRLFTPAPPRHYDEAA